MGCPTRRCGTIAQIYQTLWLWVPAFAGTTGVCLWFARNPVMTRFELTASAAPGTVPTFASRYHLPHVHHHLALDSLHHHGCARAGRTQCHAALADWAARDLGRDQYPFSVRLSVLDRVLCARDRRDRRSHSLADGGVLAVALARRAEPDRGHRYDAGRDERPLLRGDDGVSEDRSDSDRDLRLHLSRRSPHRAEGDRDPDRDHRRGHYRAAARRRKKFRRDQADHHRPSRRGLLRVVGGRLSRRDHHGTRRFVRHGSVLYAGVRPVRADTGADDLSVGPRARCAREDFGFVEALDARGFHGRVRLAILVLGVRAHGGRQRAHAGAGRGAVRAGRRLLLVQAAAVGARAVWHRADRYRGGGI